MNSNLSDKTPSIVKKGDKLELKKSETFISFLHDTYNSPELTISDTFQDIDNSAIALGVGRGALNNARGDWYEWLIGVNAWNYRIENSSPLIILSLPNKRRFDVSTLYVETLSEQISDLKEKVSNSSDVELITSNPDFVIIDTSNINIDDDVIEKLNTPIEDLTSESLEQLDNSYQYFIGQCSFDDIRGYFSVKTTFRPDRRLQIPHEGSLMKAIHVHLQTRSWIIAPKPLKYYAAATKVSDSDRDALKTVATHSITNVSSKPQAAVDNVFTINTHSQLLNALAVILELHIDE